MAASRRNRYQGTLLAVEGLDAASRAGQIHLIERWLRQQGVAVTVCRALEPGGGSPMAASLSQAAEIHECVDREIVPLLRAGRFVCVDGYVTTAAARDAARGLSRKWIRNLYRRAVTPRLGLYYRLPLDAALRLKRPPETDYPRLSGNLEENFRLYQGRIVEEMDRLAQESDFHVIDATRKPEEQQKEAREIIRRVLLASEHAPAT